MNKYIETKCNTKHFRHDIRSFHETLLPPSNTLPILLAWHIFGLLYNRTWYIIGMYVSLACYISIACPINVLDLSHDWRWHNCNQTPVSHIVIKNKLISQLIILFCNFFSKSLIFFKLKQTSHLNALNESRSNIKVHYNQHNNNLQCLLNHQLNHFSDFVQ